MSPTLRLSTIVTTDSNITPLVVLGLMYCGVVRSREALVLHSA